MSDHSIVHILETSSLDDEIRRGPVNESIVVILPVHVSKEVGNGGRSGILQQDNINVSQIGSKAYHWIHCEAFRNREQERGKDYFEDVSGKVH